METGHRNVRLLHQIDEFLDIDSTQSHSVADFVALIDAVREGLTQIDESLRIPDSQVNLHFLTKLKARPEWRDWTMMMLRDGRVNSSELTESLTFRELAALAIKQEKAILKQQKKSKSDMDNKSSTSSLTKLVSPRVLTQDDINSFVVHQMGTERASRRLSQSSSPSIRGHTKRPSQEEINEYVIRQMRREQEQTTRVRSHSHPEPPIRDQARMRPTPVRCTFCGDSFHQSTNCWRRWRLAVEALQGNAPKSLETRNGVPIQPRVYVSGFTPF